MDTSQLRLTELTRTRSIGLLASVSFGRVVFTYHALPAIRPVSHVVEGEEVILRSYPGSAVVPPAADRAEVIVAYEADEIDAVTGTGWTVVVTGTARLVRDPADVSHYDKVLRPWVADEMSQVVSIHPEIVMGYDINPA